MPKRKIRILVVDDSIFIQKLLVVILESDPDLVVVGVAKNGRQAVEMVATLNPDLVTMDMIMPEMGGGETFDRLPYGDVAPFLVHFEELFAAGPLGPHQTVKMLMVFSAITISCKAPSY